MVALQILFFYHRPYNIVQEKRCNKISFKNYFKIFVSKFLMGHIYVKFIGLIDRIFWTVFMCRSEATLLVMCSIPVTLDSTNTSVAHLHIQMQVRNSLADPIIS